MSKEEQRLVYFWMYTENKEAIESMSAETVKKILLQTFEYCETGERPELKGEENLLFLMLKKGVDEAKKAYFSTVEKNRENAMHRWHPELFEPKETKEKPKTPVRAVTNYKLVVDMFHEVCTSFPKVTTLSDKRKAAIKRLMNNHKEEEIKEAFTIAESTPFLKGDNNRGWKANFDWLINETNFIKVIEHNYDHNKNGDDIDVDRTGYGDDSEWISNF